ncbi:MAG: hypothetical protein ACJ8FY_14050 [Gemmataceae bacterium]
MRLTLRTLLAYLDDTLPANEIREIGQKVSESDAAQELIARIKQVTRRRRLTSPPATGPGAKVDPNTIAEYLDNLLPSEQVAEVEKICLESDVHLAEIAACHQILTLVLGQRAAVPPMARQRMYGLVHGREAVPTRRAVDVKTAEEQPVGADGHNEGDEALLMGLPLYGKQSLWMRWALPIVAVCLLGALAFALYKVIQPADQRENRLVAATSNGKEKTNDKTNASDLIAKDKTDTKKEPDTTQKSSDDNKKKESDNANKAADGNKKEPSGPQKEEPAIDPKKELQPSAEKKEIARCISQPGATPTLLLHGVPGTRQWTPIPPEKPVSTNDTLVALPGIHADVRLNSGVQLRLHGNLEEFMEVEAGLEPCLESAVVLHANPKFDLDFTLSRGRVYISNDKEGPASVRLRFHQEIWDFTLESRDTEIAVDLTGRNTMHSPFQSGIDPRAQLVLCVLKGHAGAKIGYERFALQAPPGEAQLFWNNEGRGLQRPSYLKENLPIWNKTIAHTKLAEEMKGAVEQLWKNLINDKKSVEVTLQEALDSTDPRLRILAVLYLGALDDVSTLIDALGDQEPSHFDVRRAAIFALQHWIGRDGTQDDKLYNSIKKTGILIDKKFTQADAEKIMQLLHQLSEEQINSPETYDALIGYLLNKRLAIRELAYWHLALLVREGRSIPYNPAEGTDQREAGYEQWKKLIPTGKLPPSLAAQPTKPAGNK